MVLNGFFLLYVCCQFVRLVPLFARFAIEFARFLRFFLGLLVGLLGGVLLRDEFLFVFFEPMAMILPCLPITLGEFLSLNVGKEGVFFGGHILLPCEAFLLSLIIVFFGIIFFSFSLLQGALFFVLTECDAIFARFALV